MSAPPPLKLRIGFITVDASQTAEVSAALEKSNAHQRIAGLPDTLNPGVIDPAKATALLNAIAKMPPDAQAPFTGNTLYLNGGDLGIGASAPTTEASFAEPFTLAAIDTDNGLVTAQAKIQPDCTLAKSRAGEARHQFGLAEQEVQALTTESAKSGGGDTLRSLSAARSRRYAIAQVWRENAAAVAACSPNDAEAAKELAHAKHLAKTTIVPPTNGMP